MLNPVPVRGYAGRHRHFLMEGVMAESDIWFVAGLLAISVAYAVWEMRP